MERSQRKDAVVTTRMTPALAERLSEIARAEGRTRSAIIRRALEAVYPTQTAGARASEEREA